VEDEQCLVQVADALEQHVLGEILDEGAADAEFSPRERDLDLALGVDLLETILE
jgi:hypothetical protein